jgi:hypothetical protein
MYVRSILFILICTFFAGCGGRVLAPSSVERLRNDIANIKQASSKEVTPSSYSQQAINQLSIDMAVALGISLDDLDYYATVKTQEWNTDPKQAGKKVEEAVKNPTSPSGAWWGLAAVVGTGLAVTALRALASSGTGGLPQLAGVIGSLLGWTLDPKAKAIRDKLEVAINKASEDPSFNESVVGKELSKVMTPEEKIIIKRKKAKKYYENAKRA